MKFGTIMKEGLEAVVEPGCAAHGRAVCECCETRSGPANAALEGLDDATIARMDWAAQHLETDAKELLRALTLAETAAEEYGQRRQVEELRRIRARLEAFHG